MIRFLCAVEKEILHFMILEQDESQRRKEGEDIKYCTRKMSNGLIIMSDESPWIDSSDNVILIRGANKENDYRLVSDHSYIKGDAEIMRSKIIDALQEWAYTGGFARCKNDAIYQDKPPIYNF